VIFDWKNYDLWERTMRTALKAENILMFIDGTLEKPEPKKGDDMSEL